MGTRAALALLAVVAVGCDPYWEDNPPVAPTFEESSADASRPPPPPQVDAQPAAPAPALALSDEEAAALDPRPSRLHPRTTALLVNEASSLRTLERTMPGDGPDKANVLRRLAEDYVELAAAAARRPIAVENLAPGAEADKVRDAIVRARAAMVTTARRAAITTYAMILEQSPSSAYAAPNEVRYYRALECARAGDLDAARRGAEEVIEHVPGTPWAERARHLLAVLRHGAAKDVPPPAPHASSAPSATCALDMECEGANVCRDGACVSL